MVVLLPRSEDGVKGIGEHADRTHVTRAVNTAYSTT
jgi:hypothetical protein